MAKGHNNCSKVFSATIMLAIATTILVTTTLTATIIPISGNANAIDKNQGTSEICGDEVDNDRDILIDEDCPRQLADNEPLEQ